MLGHRVENPDKPLLLLNVDVSNKAFPKPYNSLIDLLSDMEREFSTQYRKFVVDLSRPLSDEVATKLHAHLSGLELCYCSDGSNKTIKKYFELGDVPERETFEMKKDDKKLRISVQNYFAEELKRQIRYPNLRCIRMGNRASYISVPMEYCAILGNQVSVLTGVFTKRKVEIGAF